MHEPSKAVAWLALAALAALVAGCPVLEVVEVGLKPGASTPTRLTLTARISAEEAEDPVKGDGSQEGVQGVVGFWLPAGWTALEARMRAPGAAGFERLVPVTGYDAAFPVSFPYVPGRWWPFVTPCQYLPEGAFEYEVEVDVERPADATEGTVGIQVFAFDEKKDWSNATEVRLDLGADAAAIATPPIPPAAGGDGVPARDAAVACPVRQVRPGPRGCACGAAGGRAGSSGGILSALARIFEP